MSLYHVRNRVMDFFVPVMLMRIHGSQLAKNAKVHSSHVIAMKFIEKRLV